MRRPRFLLCALLLVWAGQALALDFSAYQRKEVDWGDAQIAEPPQAVRDRLAGKVVRGKILTRPIVINKPGVYDFENIVHVARFSKACDQKEGRPPMLHVRSGGVTVRRWIGIGTGHDGIHVHSGSGQGWKSRGLLKGVRFERCWQQACEDAVTIGFNTRDVKFDRCGFIPNPNGEFRDKLVQLNHADAVVFDRCYFGPTKNGIEFKSGARISVRDSVFDHCSTALRVRTADQYGGIKPDQPTVLNTERCRFHRCHHPAYLDGTVRWVSSGDKFERTMRSVKKNGARIDLR